jgi:hypothetical protein
MTVRLKDLEQQTNVEKSHRENSKRVKRKSPISDQKSTLSEFSNTPEIYRKNKRQKKGDLMTKEN